MLGRFDIIPKDFDIIAAEVTERFANPVQSLERKKPVHEATARKPGRPKGSGKKKSRRMVMFLFKPACRNRILPTPAGKRQLSEQLQNDLLEDPRVARTRRHLNLSRRFVREKSYCLPKENEADLRHVPYPVGKNPPGG